MSGVAVICGMRSEAALLPRGVVCACSGGRAARVYDEARRLLAEGALGLMSFGIAGGLDPALAPGALAVGTAVAVDDDLLPCDSSWVEALVAALAGAHAGVIVGAADPVTYPLAKASLHRRWQALAVDLESGAVARACTEANKPFAVLRAIADPASRTIPPTALKGITASGRMNPFAVARGLLARPADLPGLVRLGGEARVALEALAGAARRLGSTLGFEAGMAIRHK